jgi:HlyD family secretion protein
MRGLITLIAVVGLVAGGGWYWYEKHMTPDAPKWSMAKVERGDLDLVIRATGTIEPQTVIDVGAQVNGLVKDFGSDPAQPTKMVDYNSQVEVGTVLAHLDDSLYKATYNQAKANLMLSDANLQTNLAKLKQAINDFERAKLLWPKKVMTDADYDATVAEYETAQAAVDQAKAQIAQAQATLDQAQTNLDYTIIHSPVKGTIIDRRVNIGQTVVASLSAPSLFLIAQDLKQMQIWASVNEADIGQIHAGQTTEFTVDALPKRIFKGIVSQIRLNATMTQNVVTYTVVVDTDNSDEALKPYLTATVQFDAGRHDSILKVPNAALRWKPRPEFIDLQDRAKYAKHVRPLTVDHATPKEGAKIDKPKQPHGTLWVVDGEYLVPKRVDIGVTDGVTTEITPTADIKEGTEIVTGEEHLGGDSTDTKNPFAPQLFKRKG